MIVNYCLCLLDMENQLDGGAWTELLTDKWFGSNDPYSGTILGKFEFLFLLLLFWFCFVFEYFMDMQQSVIQSDH